MAGPAVAVTRDRPSLALVVYSAAALLALSAACFACCWAAPVVLSKRRAATLRTAAGVRRIISGRARAEDIVGGSWVGWLVGFGGGKRNASVAGWLGGGGGLGCAAAAAAGERWAAPVVMGRFGSD